jgi:acyl carrier protein
VVFTSALPLGRVAGADELSEQIGTLVHSQTQTSQVWLDHQVMEDGGELSLVWDFVDGLFEPAAADAAFDRYTQAVRALAEHDEAWMSPPPKTAKRALAHAQSHIVASAAAAYVAPRTPMESSVASLWERVLGVGPYGADDDFILSGGDSLLGARLISAIESSFSVTVSMTELHEERTVGALALLIEERVLERELAGAPEDGGAGR